MNKITKLKGMISTIKSSSIYAQDPESFSANLEVLNRDLAAEMEKAKARRIARKARKGSQSTAPTFPTLNGVAITPFGFMGTKPLADPSRFDLEVKLFAQQVMRDQGMTKAALQITRCRTSHARKTVRFGVVNLSVIFGTQSIDRAATSGFLEYKQCQPLIRKFKTTGISGVRLLVLHELAHIAVFLKHTHRMQAHGHEFLTEYNMLLNQYQSALELK